MENARKTRIVWVLVPILILAAAYVLFAPYVGWVTCPAHILLSTDVTLEGSRIYVDGRHVLTVRRKAEVIHFRLGDHSVVASRQGYTPARLSYRVTDDEQGSRDRLVLRRRGQKLVLNVD